MRCSGRDDSIGSCCRTRIALLNFLAEGGVIGSVSSPALARVVELVDTQVSEACALTAWEFESPLGHQCVADPWQRTCVDGT